VNGQKIGSRDSLSTAHRYPVAAVLKPGKNTIVVRVDNRMKVDIGKLGHAYTEETQSIWNGLIGKIALVPKSAVKILANPLRVVVSTPGDLDVRIKPINGDAKELPWWTKQVSTPGTYEVPIPSDATVAWSEFNPALYQVDCTLQAGDTDHQASLVTGFRSVSTEGTELRINGQKAFMRGTLECCIFPKTGYPPTDEVGWDKVFGTLKKYGLNHLRFHSYCPPEAAFASADRHGIYVQAELPNWTFKMGKLPETDAYLMEEGKRIMEAYSHHPSFVFFSIGNELSGDFQFVDKMVAQLRKLAPHILYTSTSYSFSPRGLLPGPEDDFYISQRTKTGWVRGQGFLNQTVPNTDSDYAEGLKCLDIPLISHEVGQYNVYPNLKELPKYDGNLRALNMEAIQNDLRAKGRLDDAEDYTANSGALARLLYKEDIERALRTKGLSGIQLLDLHDFPGQSTATVGLLDAFWDSKGLISPTEFRRFCSPVVPLVRIEKLTWSDQETFKAKIEVANFGNAALENQQVQWQVENEEGEVLVSDTVSKATIPVGNGNQIVTIEVPLKNVDRASQMRLSVSLDGTEYANDWKFWVYPESDSQANSDDVEIVRAFGKPLFDALAAGRRVLYLPKREEICQPLDGRFIPVFWSPLHFPNQPGALGTVIQSNHPVFDDFPTSPHTDWQWWELLATSTSVDMSWMDPDADSTADFPIVQFIDKYNRNALPSILWEAKVGQGLLMVCSLDIESDPQRRLVAKQLKRSILSYLSSEKFSPAISISPKKLLDLFRARPYRIRLAKGTSHPNYALTNCDDNDVKTIWHTDWRDANNQYPYHIIIGFDGPIGVNGIQIHQRNDSSNGVIDDYQISISEDGENWKTIHQGSKPSGKIVFDRSVVAKAVRFEALSEQNGKEDCAIAELSPVFDSGNTGVDELGLIEGFNTPAE
ncbi:discoidin domain-containing protein, partial [Crateriforma spongiae]|uniref:discoidin domain-containing protein n=1 Tax=Crateriforma spongiae TaxID=2724528 RepID=UPI0014475440